MARQSIVDRLVVRSRLVVAAALILFAAICALRFAIPNPGDGIGQLYVVPIAMLAVQCGWWVGLGAGVLAMGLWSAWALTKGIDVTPVGLTLRAVTYLFLGWLIGYLSMRQRKAEGESLRWFEMSNMLLCVASLDGYLVRLNPAWEDTLGYTREELMSRPYAEFVHPDDREATTRAAGGLADGPSEFASFENRFGTKDGGWRWLLWSAKSDGECVYGAASDITDRKVLEGEREDLLTKVEAIARTDDLTGLPNRRSWDEELGRELARARREGHAVTVAMMDLDHFKAYNDDYGHQAGDAFLKEIALTWRRALRAGDFLARYGGEEFGVILRHAEPGSGVPEIVERLRAATPRAQTCSVGFATWDGTESPEAITGRADEALYRAKRDGRDRVLTAD